MAKLPYSRVLDITVSRSQQFPSRRGFGVPLFLTTATVSGVLDSTHLTVVYGSMEEVADDWASNTQPYLAAEAAFSQNPRPLQIKLGYIPSATSTKAAMKTALDAIVGYDDEWYWADVEATMRDTALVDGLIEWIETRNKIAVVTSNDADMENPADTTNVAARYKGVLERSAIVYHTDATKFPGYALAAKLGTFNFDEPNSAYTAKFKSLALVTAVNKGSAAVQGITGFTPKLGQAAVTGHLANVYVDIGGQAFMVEGSVLKANVFIDEIHATDWIIMRTQEETLAILLNNARVPFTDAGMEMLASGARTVMRQADRAGLVADDLNPDTGLYEAAVVFEIPSVFSVPESQRKARIAPPIKVTFRYSGAVHFATINYYMTF